MVGNPLFRGSFELLQPWDPQTNAPFQSPAALDSFDAITILCDAEPVCGVGFEASIGGKDWNTPAEAAAGSATAADARSVATLLNIQAVLRDLARIRGASPPPSGGCSTQKGSFKLGSFRVEMLISERLKEAATMPARRVDQATGPRLLLEV